MERGGNKPVRLTVKRPPKAEGFAMHRLSLGKVAELIVRRANGAPQFRFDLGLIFEFRANAPCRLVEKFAHGRFVAQSNLRISALEHFLEETGDLFALGGFGPSFFLLGLS